MSEYYILDYPELLSLSYLYGIDGATPISIPLLSNEFTVTDVERANIVKSQKNKELAIHITPSTDPKAIALLAEPLEHLELICNNSSLIGFTLPNNLKRLKKIDLLFRHFSHSLDLDYPENIEEIRLNFSALTSMRLSHLLYLKKIQFIGYTRIAEITLTASQIQTITFDFANSDFSMSKQTLAIILFLREQGANVILTPEQQNSLNTHAFQTEEKSSATNNVTVVVTPPDKPIANKPETKKTTTSQPKVESYNTAPSGMQKYNGTTHQAYQTTSLLNENGPINASKYRHMLRTEIAIENERLVYLPYRFNENKSTLINIANIQIKKHSFNQKKAKDLSQIHPGSFVGKLSLSIDNTEWIPLKCLSLNDELTFIDKESIATLNENGYNLEIRYTEETRQYFVSIKKTNQEIKSTQQIIQFHYAMCPTKEKTWQKAPKPATLPTDLINGIKYLSSVKENKELTEIFSPWMINATRIQKIFDYCSKFEDISFDTKHQEIKTLLPDQGIRNSDLHEFLARIYTKAGTCHERSRACMALASYFNIPTRLNKNDTHEFIEYYNGSEWVSYNELGGSEAVLHTTNSWEETKTIPDPIENKNEFASTFKSDPKTLDESKEFEGWYQTLITLPSLPPLIQVNQDLDVLNLHSQLMRLPENVYGKNYFYIENASDFERFLIPPEIINGKLSVVKGPLLNLLEDENREGILLINWSNFTDKEIGNFKSIFDPYPTLQGYSFSRRIKTINMDYSTTNNCQAFHTRTQKVIWPKNLDTIPKQLIKPPIIANEIDEKATDLYTDEWEANLIGESKLSETGYIFKPGALLTAINSEKNAIHLSGAPTTAAFNIFLERVQREGGFYANNEWHLIPVNFTFYLHPAPESKLFSNADIFDPNDGVDAKDQPVLYINKQNYDALFNRFSIENKKARPIGGLLSTLPPHATLVFTDHISDAQTRKLEAELKKLNKLDTIQIKKLSHLSENAPKFKQPRTELTTSLTTPQSSIILTSDVDGALSLLEEKNAETPIPISTATEFSHLFENITLIQSNDSSNAATLGEKHPGFDYQDFELLKSLRDGKTVFLKGEISDELSHQLETLFATPPYLLINGIKENIPGKLILITPENKNSPHLFDGAAKRYTFTPKLDQKHEAKKEELSELSLETLFQNALKDSSFVTFHGETGTGKTHFIETNLPADQTSWGEEKIIEWLGKSTDQPHYLILKNANIKPSGYWDFLQGLESNRIYYNGKFYPVNLKTHKVIFTEHPAYYPGRHHHPFLGKINKVCFEAHTSTDLKETVIIPYLNKAGYSDNLKNQIANHFIHAYEQAKATLPHEPISIRDIKALLDHFKHPTFPEENNVLAKSHLACKEVFSGLFKDDKSKKAYFNHLEEKIDCSYQALTPLPEGDPSYVLPTSRQLLWHNVHQYIAKQGTFKKGMRRALLVEGPSGIGKSEMMVQALKKRGFSVYNPKNPNQTNIYFHLTIGTDNIAEIIQKAADLGAVLVIDELNLLTIEDEILLADLLEGRNLKKGITEINPNFFVLASQNAQSETGGKLLPKSLLNLFDRMYEEPFTKDDLLEICYKSGKFLPNDQRAKDFVNAFWTEQELDPVNVGARTFFVKLQEHLKPSAKKPEPLTSSNPMTFFHSKKSPALATELTNQLAVINIKYMEMKINAENDTPYQTAATTLGRVNNFLTELNSSDHITSDNLSDFTEIMTEAKLALSAPRGWKCKQRAAAAASTLVSCVTLGAVNYYTGKSMTSLFHTKTHSFKLAESLELKLAPLLNNSPNILF